jgi:hypothetical protein
VNSLRFLRASVLAVFLVAGGVQSAWAAQPIQMTGSMSIVGDAHGFKFTGERTTSHGTVVDTFASDSSTISIVGQPGTTVTVDSDIVLPNGGHGFLVGTTTSRQSPATATMANNLMDLGMRSSEALAAESSSAARVAVDSSTATLSTVPYTPDPSQIFTSTCYTISLKNDIFHGYGCGQGYKVWSNAGNWLVLGKYWVSMAARGNLYGWKLKGVYWRMQWPKGNTIQAMNPVTTTNGTQNCGTVSYTLNLTVPGTNIGYTTGYSVPVCQDYYGPWMPSGVSPSLSSGARWYSSVGVNPDTVMGIEGDASIWSPTGIAIPPASNYYMAEY